ncbi:lipase 1-like [Harmonia axyridis]|uniref:lipase 1-like n=1 Tax=Harmonia axyridis TaxID=115357 RepID=UPI001E275D88|nr:lipase 1-like [Harmonia axyridis]
MKFHVIIVCFVQFSLYEKTFADDHPDTYLSIEELVQKYGYPIESHEITTEDEYMITIYRIRHGKDDKTTNTKPILLMHGLFSQCEHYITNGMNNGSLAYLLADNGYDVWLGNSRGNQHGRKHKYLSPEEKEFWDFSWHEIGMYDIPAMVDHILSETGKKKLHYVGHSQGGTALYIMTSMKPEYQEKLGLVSLLAPAGYFRHFRSPLIWPLVVMERELVLLTQLTNIYELPPKYINLPELLLTGCKHTTFRLRQICEISYHLGIGGDSGLFRQEMLPLVVRFIPTASTRQPLHYSQAINSGHFRPWDYGEDQNYEIYGRAMPPDYPIENITTPIAIYYGNNDILTSLEDIEEISDVLPNVVRRYLIPNVKWTHMDFIMATNAARMLNIPLLNFLKKFDSKLESK